MVSKFCLQIWLFLFAARVAIAYPSGTELHCAEPYPLSRDHLPDPPRSYLASIAHLRDRTIDAIWQIFDPSPTKSFPYGRQKGSEAGSRSHARYADQLVLRFKVNTDIEAASLAEAADVLFLDIWAFWNDQIDILVRQDVVPSLLGLLPESLQKAHTPLMTSRELVRAVANTYPSHLAAQRGNSFRSKNAHPDFVHSSRDSSDNNTNIFFHDYRPLNVITHWMRLLDSLFHAHATLITVGETDSGRPIQALRIGAHPKGTEPRKTILVTAGSHAREWISTSTVTYVMYYLVTSYGRSKSATRLVDEFDWVFVPTLNPDGYEYSWNVDRLWRKNRQPTSLRSCRGIDLDRSWPYKWDGAISAAATSESVSPCSESYPGSMPLEAVESRSFAAWAKRETESGSTKFVGLLDLHSYSEQVLYPYSHSCSAIPSNIEDLAELGQGLAKAIRGRGHTNYNVLSACQGNVTPLKSGFISSADTTKALMRMEGGSGSMLDWFYHVLDVRRAFQIKLRDSGAYGFLLPAEYIIPTGEEILRAVRHLGITLSDSEHWTSEGEDYWEDTPSMNIIDEGEKMGQLWGLEAGFAEDSNQFAEEEGQEDLAKMNAEVDAQRPLV